MTAGDIHAFARDEGRSILDWWLEHVIDPKTGGFHGEADRRGVPNTDADRHLVLGSRLVWTYSAASRVYGDKSYRDAAAYFYQYFRRAFWDEAHGGAYWVIAADGHTLEDNKQTYGQAFTLYALSEYVRATGDADALDMADRQFDTLETRVYQPDKDGFYEGLTRDWRLDASTALSPVNPHRAAFTMNTSLHLIEAYTNYLRVRPTARVRAAVERMLNMMTARVLRTDHRFGVFFDERWRQVDSLISYGHDIEGSWLLYETARELGSEIEARVRGISLSMARAVLEGGVAADGGLLDEREALTGEHNGVRAWWQQAEAAVGFFNAYHLSGDPAFLNACSGVIAYIRERFIDHEYGEWFMLAKDEDTPSRPKITGWKCPYHNARMCFELMERCG